MANKIFNPTTLALLCSSVVSSIAMAAPSTGGVTNGQYVNHDQVGGYNISNVANGYFENTGTINGSNLHGAKFSKSHFDKVINSGTMTGQWNGFSVENGSTIGSITNSGSVTASKQYGILVDGSGTKVDEINNEANGTLQGAIGIYVNNGGHVGTINNAGKVIGTGSGMAINNSTVGKINHTGSIQATGNGVTITNSKIDDFEIGKGASIATSGTTWGAYASAGIRLDFSSIKNFTNNGSISGAYGMQLSNGTIDKFTNNGTITGLYQGINFSRWYGNPVIKEFVNTGDIIAKDGYGIYMESNSKIESLVTSGKIVGTTAGISNINSNKTPPAHIGTITVQDKGLIQATKGNALQLVKQGPNFVSIDSVTVDNGGTIDGAQSGIWFDRNTGTNQITNNGVIQGTTGIWNDGTISSASGGVGIVVGSTGKVIGAGNVGIGNTGTIYGGINVAGSVTGKVDGIRNTGTISNTKGNNAINISGQVSSINNSGTIDAANGGVHGVKVAGAKAQLDRLTNQASGSIAGTWSGVSIEGGATVGTIDNAGTISGKKNSGIYIANSHVGNIVNAGKLTSDHHGIMTSASTVDSIQIKSGATVEATGTKSGSYGDFGILLVDSKVTNVDNAGTVTGAYGMMLKNSNIDTFVNSGTLKGNNGSGLYIAQWYNKSNIKSLVNTGTIESANDAGITLEPSSSIDNLVTSGKIIGATHGIADVYHNGLSQTYIKKITVEDKGLIEGKNGNGINWNNGQAGWPYIGAIDIQSGGTVKASQSGMWFEIGTNIGTINIDGTVEGENGIYNSGNIDSSGKGFALTVGQSGALKGTKMGLVNTGNIKGGVYIAGTVDGIQNKGMITSATDAIQIASGATVKSVQSTSNLIGGTSGYALNNAGHITNGVTLTGTVKGGAGTLKNTGTIDGGLNLTGTNTGLAYTIENDGRINGNVALNTAGNVTVTNWTVYDGNKDVKFTNQGKGKVTVNKVTLADAATAAKATRSGINTMSLMSFNGEDLAVGDVAIDSELSQLGFTSTFDAGSQTLATSLNGADTTGGILGQSVATQTMRRDFFVNSMVDEAVQSAQTNATGQEGYTSVFAKPYGSHDSYKAGGAKLSGETYGLLLGANYIQGNVGLTAFAGYEHGDHDGAFDGSNLGLTNDTFYLGATGFGTVASTANMDVFVKTGVKAAFTRNSLDRNLTDTSSQANTNDVSWGANAQLGVNYKVAQNAVITPVVGLGFTNAKVNDFSMLHAENATDSYSLNNINLPYGEVAVTWQQGWTDSIRTNVGGGVRVLFDKSQTMSSTYGGSKVDTNYDLSGSYEYVTANMAWKVNKNNEISVGYTGVFEDHGQSHNMTAKYEYMF